MCACPWPEAVVRQITFTLFLSDNVPVLRRHWSAARRPKVTVNTRGRRARKQQQLLPYDASLDIPSCPLPTPSIHGSACRQQNGQDKSTFVLKGCSVFVLLPAWVNLDIAHCVPSILGKDLTCFTNLSFNRQDVFRWTSRLFLLPK